MAMWGTLLPSWIPVTGSSRIVAAAYESQRQAVHVRFPDGAEYCYEERSQNIWSQFITPGVSKGAFINSDLNKHPYHRSNR